MPSFPPRQPPTDQSQEPHAARSYFQESHSSLGVRAATGASCAGRQSCASRERRQASRIELGGWPLTVVPPWPVLPPPRCPQIVLKTSASRHRPSTVDLAHVQVRGVIANNSQRASVVLDESRPTVLILSLPSGQIRLRVASSSVLRKYLSSTALIVVRAESPEVWRRRVIDERSRWAFLPPISATGSGPGNGTGGSAHSTSGAETLVRRYTSVQWSLAGTHWVHMPARNCQWPSTLAHAKTPCFQRFRVLLCIINEGLTALSRR